MEQYYPELRRPPLHLPVAAADVRLPFARRCFPLPWAYEKKDIAVVSIMPCTAKKFEARRPEFRHDGIPDVDHVLTTQELGRMIQEAGLHFKELEPEAFDMPFGFKTGGGRHLRQLGRRVGGGAALRHREADRREAGKLPVSRA